MRNDKQKIINGKAMPGSIRALVRKYPTNQVNRLFYGGLPHLGNALWGAWGSLEIQEAAETYEDYSLSLNLQIKGFSKPTSDKVRLGGGSPARFEPFHLCLANLQDALAGRILSDYPLAAGDGSDKASIIKYFDKRSSLKIHENNIIFSHSSTQAFVLIMEAILDYGDVIVMTAPNYGLFSFIPERVGGRVRLLSLTAADGWKINPQKLQDLITVINKELKSDYDINRGKYIFRRSDIPPRVAAFIHMNPHNPTGVVYGEKEKSLLLEISNICKAEGVLIIDDLAYSGLEYDRNNLALPVCVLEGQFDNTVTLYSLSKSYGLAGIRSGMIVANEIIVSLIRDKIFQLSDSLSVLQSSAMAAIFSPDEDAMLEKEKYLSHVAGEYYNRYIFVKAIVLGIESLEKEEKTVLDAILRENKLAIDVKRCLNGIKDVGIVLKPESGFFVLLDCSRLLGKTYKGFKITDDKTLLQVLYTSGNIKALTGKAFCWGDRSQLVVRVATSLEYADLLKSFLRLKRSVEALT